MGLVTYLLTDSLDWKDSYAASYFDLQNFQNLSFISKFIHGKNCAVIPKTNAIFS